MHEYSMRGLPRERYIYFIALIAVAATAIANQAAGSFGVAISITTVSIFTVAYFAFDRWIWSWPVVNTLLGIPNLSGEWAIQGHTEGADGVARDWTGAVCVKQTWSRIAISIETELSRSRSGVASIEKDPGYGYRLVYGYDNSPKGTCGELRSHRGTCEVIVQNDLRSALATYFNDHQRRTCGTMVWQKKLKAKEEK